jgi:hypothetical protein
MNILENITIVTSIINIPDKPFSYTSTRSIYSRNERFEQTKYTIQTIKNKIPDNKIIAIECSELNEEEIEYINNNVDYFINLYGNVDLEKYIFGISKSMGENTLLLTVINYLKENNIQYNNFYKISGRYWLTDKFNYDNFNNDKITYVCEKNNVNDVYTSFYKLNSKHIDLYVNFINANKKLLMNCICAEIFFGIFLNTIDECEKNKIEIAGVAGYIAVWNNYFLEY